MSPSTLLSVPSAILFVLVMCSGLLVPLWATASSQVAWLESQLVVGTDPTRTLIHSFDDEKHEAHIYSDALAVIVFTHAGRRDLAKAILDTYWAIYENSEEEGRGRPPCRLLYDERNIDTLTPALAKGADGFRTGENAWLVIAMNYYELATGDSGYAPFASDLLDGIVQCREDNPDEIAFGAFRWNNDDLPPYRYSTEFQHDLYSALKIRAQLSGNPTLAQDALELREYLTDDPGPPLAPGKTKVWLHFDSPLHEVFNGELYDGDAPIYLDAQAWGVLSLYPPQLTEPDFSQALRNLDDGGGWSGIRADVVCNSTDVSGFAWEFSGGEEYVSMEGTAFFAEAARRIGEPERAEYFLGSLEKLLAADGSLIHSCAAPSSYPIGTWPENYRYPGVSATAWYYFATHDLNPFQPGIMACNDGLDNDGDGLIDYSEDPECLGETDLSEEPDCADRIDNDGDDAVDFPADVGCASLAAGRENPACQDGKDNDGDGKIDFDGGASAHVPEEDQTDPDSHCRMPTSSREKSRCGLGFELILVLPVLVWGYHRRSKSKLRGCGSAV